MATLKILFTPQTPLPSGGYTVRYRKVGTTAYTILENQTISPLLIENVEDGASYEGDIKAVCSNTLSSAVVSFRANYQVPLAPCVTVEEFIGVYQSRGTCLGVEYDYERSAIVASIPSVHTQDIIVRADFNEYGPAGSQQFQIPITIPAGQLSAQYEYSTKNPVDPGNESVCRDEVQSYQGTFTQSPSCGTTGGGGSGQGGTMTKLEFKINSTAYATIEQACAAQTPLSEITEEIFRVLRQDGSANFEPFYLDAGAINQLPTGHYYYVNDGQATVGIMKIDNENQLGTVYEMNNPCQFVVPDVMIGFPRTSQEVACAEPDNNLVVQLFTSNGQLTVGQVVSIINFSDSSFTPLISAFAKRNDGGLLITDAQGQVTQLQKSCVGVGAPDPYQPVGFKVKPAVSTSAAACALEYNPADGLTIYAAGTGTATAVGDKLYLDSLGTQPLPAGFYRAPDVSFGLFPPTYSPANYQVGAGGEILAFNVC